MPLCIHVSQDCRQIALRKVFTEMLNIAVSNGVPGEAWQSKKHVGKLRLEFTPRRRMHSFNIWPGSFAQIKDQLPETLFVFSDMQFDAVRPHDCPEWSTTHQLILKKFRLQAQLKLISNLFLSLVHHSPHKKHGRGIEE